MTWSVDPPVRAGPVLVCAVVERRVDVRAGHRALSAVVEKRPVLLLVSREGRVSGFDLSGNPVSRAEIDRRYPGAADRIMGRASSGA